MAPGRSGLAPSPASRTSSVGDARPRIEVYPAYAYSRAKDAVDLWELAAGGPMDPWQRDSEEILCGVADDDTWACPEYLELVARQNGKGVILEARVLAGFMLWLERLILWSAQLRDTALEGFLRVEDLLRNLGRGVGKNMIMVGPVRCPKTCRPGNCQFDRGKGHIIPIKVNYTNGKEQFMRLDTRQRIKVITRSEQSGRGLSPDVIVVDEAMFFTDAENEALAFAQSARPNPQMIYTSSPPKDGDSGEVLFRLRDRAIAMLNGESQDVEDEEDDEPDALGARIWGVEGDLDNLGKIDLRDVRNVTAANPAYGIRVKPRTVRRERRKMTQRGFARERLCIWPVPRLVAGGRIDPDKWEALQDSSSTWVRSIGCSFGVEVSPELDAAAIVLYGVREDDLGHVELVDRRVGITWVAPRLKELKQEKNPIAIGMNAMTFGVLKADLKNAGMIRPEDRKHDDDKDPEKTRPRRGDLLVTGGPDSAAACGQIIVAVDERGIRVKPHPVYPEIFDAAVTGAKTQRSGDALKWVRSDKTDEIEISPTGAMSSARFAHLSRVGVLVEEKPPPAAPLVLSDGPDRDDSGGGLMDVGF